MPSISDQRDLLGFFARSFAEDIALLAGSPFADVRLSSKPPLEINDLTGEHLFLDYSIVDASGAEIGAIRSSARGDELPLIDSISIGTPYFNAGTAQAAAVQRAPRDLPGCTVSSASLVCYGYPHIGILVKCKLDSSIWSLVYDATLGILVKKWSGSLPTGGRSEAGPLGPAIDGLPFYSYLDQQRSFQPEGAPSTDATAAKRQWQSIRQAFDVNAKIQPLVQPMLKTAITPDSRAGIGAAVRETLRAPRVAIRGTILPVPLVGQQTQVYCAVATVQMMLKFLGINNLSQDDIAKALGTTEVGTTNPNMIAGISRLTQKKWTANLVTSPTFDDNVKLVDQLLPAKSAIPGHARLIRGWREYCLLNDQGLVDAREQFHVINDPYPVGSGRLVLESAATPIPNFFINSLYISKAGSGPERGAAVASNGHEAGPMAPVSTTDRTVKSSPSLRAINSRTFEVDLPPAVRLRAGRPVPPSILRFLAAQAKLTGQ